MADPNSYPFLREIRSPITQEQLAPLDDRCQVVQFVAPLTEEEHGSLAQFLRDYPTVPLRAYGHYSHPVPNLKFLQHYPFLTGFRVDVFHLESTEGMEYLPTSLESFGIGQTKRKTISLGFLRRFPRLEDLFLEGHTRDIEVVSTLLNLERLTLRSITLPDLKLLLPLRNLWSLDVKLGGTKDLRLLPEIGGLKYLELWMVKGLQDVNAIGEILTLQNLFLQALKNVTALPSFSKLRRLRRVTLDTMKGISDLSPVADAPALEELFVVAANQLQLDHFKPFVGHPSLKCATIGLGSIRKNEQVEKLLGVPKCHGFKAKFEYA
jgi:internalin A